MKLVNSYYDTNIVILFQDFMFSGVDGSKLQLLK